MGRKWQNIQVEMAARKELYGDLFLDPLMFIYLKKIGYLTKPDEIRFH